MTQESVEAGGRKYRHFPLLLFGTSNLAILVITFLREGAENAGPENDGPILITVHRDGKCKTWKNTDPGTSKLANNDTVVSTAQL